MTKLLSRLSLRGLFGRRSERPVRGPLAPLQPQLPMPASLAARLRALPRAEIVCRDIDRLYGATREAVRGTTRERRVADRGVEAHLAGCERCRFVYGALATAFAASPPALPAWLRFRLAAVVYQARPAVARWTGWIPDLRFAFATSVALTALVLTIGADLPRKLRAAEPTWSERSVAWRAEGTEVVRSAWTSLASTFERGYLEGEERLATYGRLWGRLIDDSASVFLPQDLIQELERYFSNEGDDDGPPERRT